VDPVVIPPFSPSHPLPEPPLGPIQVYFTEGLSRRKCSACPTATATIQDLERELVAKYSVQGLVFEFLLVDGQTETLVPKKVVVRSLPLSSAQLTMRKVERPVNEGMQRVTFRVPQQGRDPLILELPARATICDTRKRVAEELRLSPSESKIMLLSAGRVLKDPFILENLDSDILVYVPEWSHRSS
jgi:hypothetical protein